MSKIYVSYYRVSTAKQGQSGLGLEAQKTAVGQFVKDQPVIEEFVEVESGKKDGRPQLQAAIAHAKQHSATLVIAKLDRLSRNASFIFTLRDSDVDFVCADMPDANTLTVGIFAVLAQHERELISQRTKAALAAKKAQGFKLGKPGNLTLKAAAKGNLVWQRKAAENKNNRRAKAMIHSLHLQGLSWSQIAAELNEHGFLTARGRLFHPVQVQRLYFRKSK
jgi:DNA invertase Pin-like site-specific DNA recombinase